MLAKSRLRRLEIVQYGVDVCRRQRSGIQRITGHFSSRRQGSGVVSGGLERRGFQAGRSERLETKYLQFTSMSSTDTERRPQSDTDALGRQDRRI
jgi:hypothetical protein